MDATLIAAIAAFFSAVATAFAAYAAFVSPKRAAKFHVEAIRAERSHLEKLDLFKTLMKYRKNGFPEDSLVAFNVIDVVWSDSKTVRERWVRFYRATTNPEYAAGSSIPDLLESLLSAMASELGFDDELGPDGYERAYWSPTAHANQVSAQDFVNRQYLAQQEQDTIDAGDLGEEVSSNKY